MATALDVSRAEAYAHLAALRKAQFGASHRPTLLMQRQVRIERVEMRWLHGQRVAVKICTPASCEHPIDLDRDAREQRIYLAGD